MDNKKRAAEVIMTFLPIVGQDVHTGIKTAKDCAKAAIDIMIPVVQGYEEALELAQRSDYASELENIKNFIDTF